MPYRALTPKEIETLRTNGCSSTRWEGVQVAEGWSAERVHRSHFRGEVRMGRNVSRDGCGVYDASLSDAVVGDDVRICRIGASIDRCEIGNDAVVENVAEVVTSDDATFGIGTELEPVNEAGGRVVTLYEQLNAQTAWMQAFRSHDDEFRERLKGLIAEATRGVQERRSRIGAGASVRHCGPLRNVRIGSFAKLDGVTALTDVTVLSGSEHPTRIGHAVQARQAVIAEGAEVNSGALLDRVYIGQAAKIGKQFSAENSLFFANCEGFHGEAVALFGGPYTVSHHKSTLLIAQCSSFFNAGSGTNQSNHMYKLGPVHQGILERGTKTGSFSYLLHESHVGAFSVILGKHYTNVSTADLPFSNIYESEGQSYIVPGMNLLSVGTVRDGEKWPKRDGRKASDKRDLIIFDVFSPFTAEKMRRGRDLLTTLQETTPKEKSIVQVGGVALKRLLLRKCAKYYGMAIKRYLAGEVLRRLADRLSAGDGWPQAIGALRSQETLKDPESWVDVAGLLMPQEKLHALEAGVRSGRIASVQELLQGLQREYDAYRSYEWEYVASAFAATEGYAPHTMTREQAAILLQSYGEASDSLMSSVLDDARKEYDAFARIGFGQGGDTETALRDFESVRGSVTTNSVITKLMKERDAAIAWREALTKKVRETT